LNQPTRVSDIDRWAQRMARHVAVLACFFTKHWLWFAGVALVFAVLLPLIPPMLMHQGYERAGRVGYILFSPFCHQLPERSFFLFGPQWVYNISEIEQALGNVVPSRYIGNAALGYKMALCERDMAIYGMALLGSIVFAFVRRRLQRVSGWAFLILITPMAIDGTGQLFNLWSSTWVSRLLTGGLFGLACVFFLYPKIEEVMPQAHLDLKRDIASWRRNGY